jgi:hypothetical protein
MKKDLQSGFVVLLLQYLINKKRICKEGLLAMRCGLYTCRIRRRVANKPFFMPVRNVGLGAMDV